MPLETIRKFCLTYRIPDAVFVGFSGGIDSTALLLALHLTKHAATAVHFQHGLRGSEAEQDADWCRDFCAKRGIPFKLIRLDVPRNMRHGETTEEAARRLRIEAWQNLAADGSPVFLAHHADDVLEELFLRLARGANATGLTSLRPCRNLGGVTFLRPFLELRKQQLKDFLLQNGIADWRTDSTNSCNDYRRNAIRNRALPLLREIFGTDNGLLQAVRVLKDDADCLEQQAVEALAGLTDAAAWQALPPALLPRVFRLWRAAQDGVDEAPSHAFTELLFQQLHAFDGHHPAVMQLTSDVTIHLSRNGLRFIHEHCDATEPFCFQWDWRNCPRLELPQVKAVITASTQTVITTASVRKNMDANTASELFALDAMPDILTVRNWLPGDRMTPFGRSTPKKLQDIFVDNHIPRDCRNSIPVILAENTIIWLPTVKRAEFGRLDEQNQALLLIFHKI